MKRTYNLLALLLFSLLLMAACNSGKDKQGSSEQHDEVHHEEIVELTDAQFKNVGIEFVHIEKRNMSGAIKANGMLDVPPQNLVTVSIPYGGTVTKTDLLQGMKIKKGQLLVVLEHPDYIQLQQDYIEAKSKLDYLTLELNRQEELQKENVSAAKTYQQAVSEYEAIKARVGGLVQKLSIINISPEQIKNQGITKQVKLYAPISGYVTQVHVNIGKYVTANEVICKLVDTGHLHAELTVFEKDVTQIKVGQKIRFNFNGDTKEHTASVYLIGKEIDQDRTIRVHGHLDQEDHNLLPGMYLKAYIETGSVDILTVLSEAVVQSDNKNYIFLYQGVKKENDVAMHYFKKEEVKIGIQENGYSEIITENKIDSNIKIVSKGAYDLLSKIKVGEEEGH